MAAEKTLFQLYDTILTMSQKEFLDGVRKERAAISKMNQANTKYPKEQPPFTIDLTDEQKEFVMTHLVPLHTRYYYYYIDAINRTSLKMFGKFYLPSEDDSQYVNYENRRRDTVYEEEEDEDDDEFGSFGDDDGAPEESALAGLSGKGSDKTYQIREAWMTPEEQFAIFLAYHASDLGREKECARDLILWCNWAAIPEWFRLARRSAHISNHITRIDKNKNNASDYFQMMMTEVVNLYEKYDILKGTRYNSFAHPYMVDYAKEITMDKTQRGISSTRASREQVSVFKAITKISNVLGISPEEVTNNDVCRVYKELTGKPISPNKVAEYRNVRKTEFVSLDNTISDDEEDSFGDNFDASKLEVGSFQFSEGFGDPIREILRAEEEENAEDEIAKIFMDYDRRMVDAYWETIQHTSEICQEAQYEVHKECMEKYLRSRKKRNASSDDDEAPIIDFNSEDHYQQVLDLRYSEGSQREADRKADVEKRQTEKCLAFLKNEYKKRSGKSMDRINREFGIVLEKLKSRLTGDHRETVIMYTEDTDVSHSLNNVADDLMQDDNFGFFF